MLLNYIWVALQQKKNVVNITLQTGYKCYRIQTHVKVVYIGITFLLKL